MLVAIPTFSIQARFPSKAAQSSFTKSEADARVFTRDSCRTAPCRSSMVRMPTPRTLEPASDGIRAGHVIDGARLSTEVRSKGLLGERR